MKHGQRLLALITGLALLCPGPLPARDFFLQEGTEISLRLRTSVDTKISQTGDRIIATVEEAVSVENVSVIPAGARVLGRIGEIQKPGLMGRGGRLVLTFETIEVPGAGSVPLSGSLVDLYNPEEKQASVKDVDVGQEGQVEAGGPRKLKRFGAPAAGGAVGAAAGGGLVGAAIGVALGAGIGYVWFKGKHVELPAGIGMVMRVDRGVALSVPDMPRPAASPR